MAPEWLTILSEASLYLAGLCALIIIIDLTQHPQKMWIMNLVWPITALYFSIIGLWAYYRIGRKSTKENPTPPDQKPFRQVVYTGTTHCGAGCTLGDIAGEWGVFLLGWTIAGIDTWPKFIADFILAYLCGIAFQYFTIAPMRGLSPRKGILAAIKADTLSISAFEIGMFGWMLLTRFVLFHPHLKTNEPTFWFMMQIAMIAGFVTSYPMNWWLIRRRIKEPM